MVYSQRREEVEVHLHTHTHTHTHTPYARITLSLCHRIGGRREDWAVETRKLSIPIPKGTSFKSYERETHNNTMV